MPSYSFVCKECKHTFSVHAPSGKMNESLKNPCSECGGKVKRSWKKGVQVADAFAINKSSRAEDFKENVLKPIHERTYKSKIGDSL